MHFPWPLCSSWPSGWSCSAVLRAGPRVSRSPGRKYSLSIRLRVSPLSLFTWGYVTRPDVVEKMGISLKLYFPVPTIPAAEVSQPRLRVLPGGAGGGVAGGHLLLVLQADVLDSVIDFLARTKVR